MNINERIKIIRKSLDLTQPQFAERVKISNGHIALMELAKRPVNERMIKSICDEFKVNEDWLRNGNGEMFIPDEVAFFESLGQQLPSLTDNSKRFLSQYFKLSPEEKKALEDLVYLMAEKNKHSK